MPVADPGFIRGEFLFKDFKPRPLCSLTMPISRWIACSRFYDALKSTKYSLKFNVQVGELKTGFSIVAI